MLVFPVLLAIACSSACNFNNYPACYSAIAIQSSASYQLNSAQREEYGRLIKKLATKSRLINECAANKHPKSRLVLLFRQNESGELMAELSLNYNKIPFLIQEKNVPNEDNLALIKRTFRTFEKRLTLNQKSTNELGTELTKNNNDQEIYYILEELALRADSAAIPYLSTYLAKEQRAPLFVKALGALVAIGTKEAAHEIMIHTKKKSPDMVIQMIYALEQLPGEEIYDFLLTMAHGYPNNKVREIAQNVLENRRRFTPMSGEENHVQNSD